MKRLTLMVMLSIGLAGCSVPGRGKSDDTYTFTGYVAVSGPSAITFTEGTPTGEKPIDGEGEIIENGCSVPLLDLTTRPELYGFENTLISTGHITKTSYARYANGATSEGCFFYFEFDKVPMSRSFTVKLNAFMQQRDIPRDDLFCDDSARTCTVPMRNIALSD